MTRTFVKNLALEKNLGQHFLTNRGVLEKIVAKINSLSPRKEVVEIGPGGGALTEELLKNSFRVVAVEFDDRWVKSLAEKFASEIAAGSLTLLHADATRVAHEKIAACLADSPVSLVGNLPYNRGSEIVLRYFEEAGYVDAFVVMLQREVADKFLPKGDDRRAFGPQSVKFDFLAEKLETFPVSAGSFKPPPKVESSVLSFRRKKNDELDPVVSPANYESLSRFLKAAFAQRRKKLSNNLGKKARFPVGFEAFADKRAEELNSDELLALWRAFNVH